VNFDASAPGEWMLVYNEIKLYRDHQIDCEFAMVKDNYQARIYSPFGYGLDKDGNPTTDFDTAWDRQSRYYNGVDSDGNDSVTVGDNTYSYDKVTAGSDIYEPHYNEDPFHIEGPYEPQKMPAGTTMIPRVFKTNVGDIFTTNTINANLGDLTVGDTLKVGDKGILEKGTDDKMVWQVVKLYTMPDHQPGVKLMRVV
jgi:hypothetical protein